MEYKHSDTTSAIINAFYHVYNVMGHGFLEKVYENALAIELRKRGHTIVQQAPVPVFYEDATVGEYYADVLVDDVVIVELKAVEKLLPTHEAQLVHYLKSSRIEVGLLVNFGPKADVRRKIYDRK